eukprot:5089555-Lingulodinium_polyedra.AAC.1
MGLFGLLKALVMEILPKASLAEVAEILSLRCKAPSKVAEVDVSDEVLEEAFPNAKDSEEVKESDLQRKQCVPVFLCVGRQCWPSGDSLAATTGIPPKWPRHKCLPLPWQLHCVHWL